MFFRKTHAVLFINHWFLIENIIYRLVLLTARAPKVTDCSFNQALKNVQKKKKKKKFAWGNIATVSYSNSNISITFRRDLTLETMTVMSFIALL